MTNKLFINASLSTLAEQQLNEEIARIADEVGYKVYLPQNIIPPGPKVSPMRVYEANAKAIKECDVILSVLDKPGSGVIFELGYASALKKPIIVFRSDEQDYLGKVIEGLWIKYDKKHKAKSLIELKKVLTYYINGNDK